MIAPFSADVGGVSAAEGVGERGPLMGGMGWRDGWVGWRGIRGRTIMVAKVADRRRQTAGSSEARR